MCHGTITEGKMAGQKEEHDRDSGRWQSYWTGPQLHDQDWLFCSTHTPRFTLGQSLHPLCFSSDCLKETHFNESWEKQDEKKYSMVLCVIALLLGSTEL